MARKLCCWAVAIAFLGLFIAGCTESPEPPPSLPVAAPNGKPAQLESVPSRPGDWPMWRGARGDGISSETGWTNDWPADGPKKLWTAEVGTGFSSMAVAGGRVYTMGHEPTTAAQEKEGKLGNDTVWCLDTADGHVVWKQSYPCQQVAVMHEGGPGATPTVDGDHVYTLSKDGQLFCFDGAANGRIVWKVELQPLLGVEMPLWGFSGSPRVFNDTVIVEAGRTVALDKATGTLRWKTEKYLPGYGSPTLFAVDGKPLVAVLNNNDLLVVRADDGTEVAKAKWETQSVTSAATPIVEQAAGLTTIFISTGYKRGCALFDLKDGKLVKRYENKKLASHMATGVVAGGVIYGINGNTSSSAQCSLVAMKYDTGEVFWSEHGLGCGTLLLAGDRLIALGDTGKLAIIRADPKQYKLLASAEVLEGKCWTMPVLAGGRIYCRNAAGRLVCLDVSK